MARDTSKLRDILFDELDTLRSGGDHKRAAAVAKLTQQIINTARVEMDFHKLQTKAAESGKPFRIGSMDLGATVAPAVSPEATNAIEHTEQADPSSKSKE